MWWEQWAANASSMCRCSRPPSTVRGRELLYNINRPTDIYIYISTTSLEIHSLCLTLEFCEIREWGTKSSIFFLLLMSHSIHVIRTEKSRVRYNVEPAFLIANSLKKMIKHIQVSLLFYKYKKSVTGAWF